jgi:hypothetical protein
MSASPERTGGFSGRGPAAEPAADIQEKASRVLGNLLAPARHALQKKKSAKDQPCSRAVDDSISIYHDYCSRISYLRI